MSSPLVELAKRKHLFILYVVIAILVGGVALMFIEAKTQMINARNANQRKEIAAKDAKNARGEFATLFARCTALEKQCTAVQKLRELQEESLYSYIRKNYKKIPELVAREIAKQTVLITAEKNAPFIIIAGVMEVESAYNPTVVSKAGARGLMQVMPKIWVKEFDYLNRGHDLHEIALGIRAGVDVYLHYYKATGTTDGALAKYFGSGTQGYQEKVYKAISKFTFHMVEEGQTL